MQSNATHIKSGRCPSNTHPNKYLTCVALLLCCLLLLGNNIEIRYHTPQATQVTMIWGVNDWNITKNKPAGTIISDNVMHSPMVKRENIIF